jgi:hypothetical protein
MGRWAGSYKATSDRTRTFIFVIPDLIRDPTFFDASTGLDLKRDPGSSPG